MYPGQLWEVFESLIHQDKQRRKVYTFSPGNIVMIVESHPYLDADKEQCWALTVLHQEQRIHLGFVSETNWLSCFREANDA